MNNIVNEKKTCCGPGYASPTEAIKAPSEKLLYTIAIYTGTGIQKPDYLATIDVDPDSPTYSKVIHRLEMPGIGDELHHMGWNACSSCHGDEGMSRKYLLVPGVRSNNIHVIDTATDPFAPRIHKIIEGSEIKSKTNLSGPHTVHCLGSEIIISFLGNARGEAPGGYLHLNKDFEIVGRWENSMGDIPFSYDFWYQPRHNVMVSSEWAAPNTFMIYGLGQLSSPEKAINAALIARENGADAVYCGNSPKYIEALRNEGLPAVSHIGLIPTFSHYCGGLRGWGRDAEEAMEIFKTLKRMEDAGVFAVEAECIAEEVLEVINDKTSIVTFSLGSGMAGDVIMSFVADICGEDSEEKKPPKHAYAFGDVGRLHKQIHEERVTALNKFCSEVSAGNFPYPQTNISMHKGEKNKLLEAIDKWKPVHQ